MFKLIFKLGRWRITHRLPKDIKQCVIIVAPHTSNWDFVYGMGAQLKMRINGKFAIKKEWLRFPFKRIMILLGALPVNRNKKSENDTTSTVDSVAALFKKHDDLKLIITPEGTRSRVVKWKTGFYYIALKAKVPIALGFMDYEKRVCGVDKLIYPSGNFEKDMNEILFFYKNLKGKNPENFSLDIGLTN